MTLDQYKEQYNQAPYELADFAAGACDLENNATLMYKAICYLEAKQEFELALKNIGVEIG